MKKPWLIILGAVIVIVGTGTAAVLTSKTNSDKNKTSSSGNEHGGAGHLGKKNACDYFRQADADQLLGAGAEKSTVNADTSSADIYVSTCTYASKADTLEEVRAMKTATLLVRAPLTETGAKSNEIPFTKLSEGTQAVTGYGDKAYWDPSIGQLNVLKDNTWLIISYGKSSMGDRTLDETKRLADIVVSAYGR